MTDMPISRGLADRLQQLAQQEGRSLEDMLNDRVSNNPSVDADVPADEENWALRMARQAEQDTDIEWNALAPHVTERSQKILRTQFAKHIMRKMTDAYDPKDERP